MYMYMYMYIYIYSFITYLCRPGISPQPIWLTNMNSYSSDKCITYSNSCPLTSVASCTHSEDVTVECSK